MKRIIAGSCLAGWIVVLGIGGCSKPQQTQEAKDIKTVPFTQKAGRKEKMGMQAEEPVKLPKMPATGGGQ